MISELDWVGLGWAEVKSGGAEMKQVKQNP